MSSEDDQSDPGLAIFSRSALDHFHDHIPHLVTTGLTRSAVLALCIHRLQQYGDVALPIDRVTGRNCFARAARRRHR